MSTELSGTFLDDQGVPVTLSSEPTLVCNHTSVGILVFNESPAEQSKLLLIKRRRPPLGFAPVAGHVDQPLTHFNMARWRLHHEVGLEASELVELLHMRLKNKCRMPDGDWHIWRIFKAHALGSVQPNAEEAEFVGWYTKEEIAALGARTQLYKSGQLSDAEWKNNPGLQEVWQDLFRQIGILDDPEQSQKRKVPRFLYQRVPIIGRYYGEEYETTQNAARALHGIGKQSYPKLDARAVSLRSADGDTFSFLGGMHVLLAPYLAQLGFFREIQRAHDLPMTDLFTYFAVHNGYLGRTASIEVAYAMMTKKRIIFSEAPTRFSNELRPEIVAIVKDNFRRYPIVPIGSISVGLKDALRARTRSFGLTLEQKKIIISSVVTLIRDLKRKYGSGCYDKS
jgi:isopentenyldiphosphate isomerase